MFEQIGRLSNQVGQMLDLINLMQGQSVTAHKRMEALEAVVEDQQAQLSALWGLTKALMDRVDPSMMEELLANAPDGGNDGVTRIDN